MQYLPVVMTVPVASGKTMREPPFVTSGCARLPSGPKYCIRQHTSAYVSISGYDALREPPSVSIGIRQHTSACVSIRQHLREPPSVSIGIRQHTSACVSIRQHTARASVRPRPDAPGCRPAPSTAYVSIRQHTPAYVSICEPPSVTSACARLPSYIKNVHTSRIRQHTAHTSRIRQHFDARLPSYMRNVIPRHTSRIRHAYVSMRQHASAYVMRNVPPKLLVYEALSY
jgi:hypothetical protein